MIYGEKNFDTRLKENIRNYKLYHLFDIAKIQDYFLAITESVGVGILLTERHGEKTAVSGRFAGITPDVLTNPGRKLTIEGRTLGHLYAEFYEDIDDEKKKRVNNLLDAVALQLAAQGAAEYLRRETAIYADELESKANVIKKAPRSGEKEDPLTGTLNQAYFNNRAQILERSETVPVAVICGNINDWKYADDNFGSDESDRLIRLIADILKSEAKDCYLISRYEKDLFRILMAVPDEGEAEDYCARVRWRCNGYEDERLAPSIAFGLVYRENVEQGLEDLFSDAEYEMFQDKISVKSESGYRERLTKRA